MAIKLENKSNVEAPSGAYPFGDVKDNTGSNDGTPLDRAVISDYWQFFAKMLDDSGVVANGLLENETNGFQYHQALIQEIQKYAFLETGSFTPTLQIGGTDTGVVYSSQEGWYTKTLLSNGRFKIDGNLLVRVTSIGSLLGDAQIHGLPFASSSTYDIPVSSFFSGQDGGSISVSENVFNRILSGNSIIVLYGDQTIDPIAGEDFNLPASSSVTVACSFSYESLG